MRIKSKNKIGFSLLLLLLLIIGIGYAYLTSNLTINGITKLAGNSWNIHFTNLVVQNGSIDNESEASIDSQDNTKVVFDVVLGKPGDYYKFNVDVVNEGTINGVLNSINISPLSSELQKIIEYKVTYEDGASINTENVLNVSETKTIVVLIGFKKDIANGDLPSSAVTIDDMQIDFEYTQDNGNGYGLNRLKMVEDYEKKLIIS